MTDNPQQHTDIDAIFAEIDEWAKKHPWRRRWYRLRGILGPQNIKFQIRRPTVWFFKRGKHGWSAYDTWALDMYLAKVIVGSVTHLKEHTHGYPGDVTADKWDAELDTIIYGFQSYLDADICKPEEYEHHMEQFKKGMRTFSKRFSHLWD